MLTSSPQQIITMYWEFFPTVETRSMTWLVTGDVTHELWHVPLQMELQLGHLDKWNYNLVTSTNVRGVKKEGEDKEDKTSIWRSTVSPPVTVSKTFWSYSEDHIPTLGQIDHMLVKCLVFTHGPQRWNHGSSDGLFTHGPRRWNRGSLDGLFLLLLHTSNLGHCKDNLSVWRRRRRNTSNSYYSFSTPLTFQITWNMGPVSQMRCCYKTMSDARIKLTIRDHETGVLTNFATQDVMK